MKPAAPRVLLLPDYGPLVGGGHAMRCLTLGEALTARGAWVAVAAPEALRAAMASFWPEGIEALAAQDLLDQGPRLAAEWRAQLALVDHYGAGARFERALTAAGARVAALDDLADRDHACDLLADPSLGRRAEDYAALAPGARILSGPSYALVRPGFAQARPAALARRGGAVERVLLSIGLTDLGGLTADLAAAILRRLGDRRLDIAVGSAAPSRRRLEALAQADDRVSVHFDAGDMPALMCSADLAVGAGGSSLWERACLGLPSLCIILADNQAGTARGMAEQGMCLTADARAPDFETAFDAHFHKLLTDSDLRADLSKRSAALCDGGGAGRVADALLELAA